MDPQTTDAYAPAGLWGWRRAALSIVAQIAPTCLRADSLPRQAASSAGKRIAISTVALITARSARITDRGFSAEIITGIFTGGRKNKSPSKKRKRSRRFADFFFVRSLVFYFFSGFIVGNKSTSRMERESVRNITILSMPMPRPPVGGMPYSSAVQKSSS